MLTLNTHVMADGASRAAFNALTLRTFGFSFEEWYRAGYGSANNIPYTLFDGAKAVANVSVNLMDVVYAEKAAVYPVGNRHDGGKLSRQGAVLRLMQTVLAQWSQRCDAMLLFANRCALDFYPRFGFERQNRLLSACRLIREKVFADGLIWILRGTGRLRCAAMGRAIPSAPFRWWIRPG